ncbi:MAG: DUF6158 family protein [Geodermatophilaceae bacterium]
MEHGVPAHELTDEELERQGLHAHATRHWVFLHGTTDQFRTHTNRMLELEQEYLHRHPKRTWQGTGDQPAGEGVAEAAQTTRIRDLVHTFVREIDYLLGSDDAEAPSEPGPGERQLIARVAEAPDGRLHKLEVHQLARELGTPAVGGAALQSPPTPDACRRGPQGRHRRGSDLARQPIAPWTPSPVPSPAIMNFRTCRAGRVRTHRTTHRHDRRRSRWTG